MSYGKRRNTSRLTPASPSAPGIVTPGTVPSSSRSRPTSRARWNLLPSPGRSFSYQSTAASASSAAAEWIRTVAISDYRKRRRRRSASSLRLSVAAVPCFTSARRSRISCSQASAASGSAVPSSVAKRSWASSARSASDSALAWSRSWSRLELAMRLLSSIAACSGSIPSAKMPVEPTR